MGVCGYTFDQVNAMPMEAIARAINSRNKLINTILRAFVGGPDEAPVAEATRPMTPALFDAIFPGGA